MYRIDPRSCTVCGEAGSEAVGWIRGVRKKIRYNDWDRLKRLLCDRLPRKQL